MKLEVGGVRVETLLFDHAIGVLVDGQSSSYVAFSVHLRIRCGYRQVRYLGHHHRLGVGPLTVQWGRYPAYGPPDDPSSGGGQDGPPSSCQK